MTSPARAAGVVAAAAVLAACTAGGTPTSAPSTGGSRSERAAPTAPGSETASVPVDSLPLLTSPATAASTRPGELRDAATAAQDGPLAGLVRASWRDRVSEEARRWPVTVGRASIDLAGRVDVDVVIDTPGDVDGRLVLRWLPGTESLGATGDRPRVTVDGADVDPVVDAPGARMVVPVTSDEGHVVRVRASYRVPLRADVEDDGSPAGVGLLARTDGAVALGHWLPLVALPSDDGPMQDRGDVGGFPPGIFSLVIEHEGQLVTGAREGECPEPAAGCTWVQGVGLRDVAAALLEDPVRVDADGVVVSAPAGVLDRARLDLAASQATDGIAALAGDLGPLPWSVVDVVALPISPGAAGMEFPGMVWVDPEAWPAGGADFGAYVLAHEVGHQWFHALVGNGSLSAPVVDESLAQYASVLVFDDVFGAGQGQALADHYLGGRHASALEDGVPDEAPAQPLAAFSSSQSYGASVYGRGGQAWVDAAAAAGPDAVLAALRDLVDQYGLRQVDADGVLRTVDAVSAPAADALAGGWGLPDP